jgi:hypothetical protein
MKAIAISIALVLMTACPGAADSSVVFYLPLDGQTDAEIGTFPKATVLEGEAAFAPGQRASAMLVGDGKAHLTFDAANIPAREGTLEFWFKPLNWNGLDTDTFHIFVETDKDDQNHWFLVYKYYTAQNAAFIWEKGGHIFQRKISGWKGWVHFAVTWSPTGCRMYFNGEASAVTVPNNPPSKYIGRMYVGDRPWQFKRDEQTLIDEMYIYNRALEPEEITWAMKNVATRPRGKDVPSGLVPTKVYAKILPLKKKIIAQVSHLSAPAKQHVSAEAQLLGPTPLGPAALTNSQAVLNFDKLQTGDYTLRVKFMDAAGKVIDQAEDKFFCPDNSWLGNTIGISDTPPPPWTPIEATDRSFNCWGRTYQFGASGLPIAIDSVGAPLLAGPVELAASVKWKYEPPKLVRQSAVKAEYQGKWTSRIGELHWQAVAEYDGMIKYSFTLNPAAGVSEAELDLLELRFPMRANSATLANCLTSTGSIMGKTPDNYLSTGARQWWLGNEQRGLSAFRSSDQAWDRLDRDGGFRIEREGDTVTVVWSFIGSKMKLTRPWQFTFGMTATPVRDIAGRRGRPSRVMPMNQWRMPRPRVYQPAGLEDLMANQGIRDEIFSPHMVLWGGGEWRTYAPTWGRPDAYRDGHAKLSAKGFSVMTYMMPCEIPQSAPQWRYWSEQWAMGEKHGWTNEVWGRTTCVPSWVDYMVAFRMKMLREYKFGGYYIDNNSARSGRNVNAGFGYERDGLIVPTYNYFGLRELFKRLYTAVKAYGNENDKPTMIMGHVSSELPVAFLGFLDNRIDGEQFLAPVRKEKKSYHDLVSLEKWRATNLSVNIGSMAVLLPEFASDDSATPDKTRSLLGLLMLHDMVGVWFTGNQQANTAAVNRMWRIQDRFGIERAKLLPYWDNAHIIAGQTDTLKVTAYRQPEGGALIVIANIDKKPITTNLQINWARLKSNGKLTVTDAETDAAIPTKGDLLKLDIPGRNHRVIWCK